MQESQRNQTPFSAISEVPISAAGTHAEQRIEADLHKAPTSMLPVYEELWNLKMSESSEVFRNDLLRINQDLHNAHLLPYFMLIVDQSDQSPQQPADFGMSNLASGEAPAPAAPPRMEPLPASGNYGGTGPGAGVAPEGGDGNGTADGGNGDDVGPIADPGGDPYDGSDPGNMTIADLAAQGLGKSLWAESPWANDCSGGTEGCAASVSVVLQEAGVSKDLLSNNVDTLAANLTEKGHWTSSSDISTAKPGDVIVGSTADAGHCGIVGIDRGQLVLYNNWSHSSPPSWHEEPLKSSYLVTHFQGHLQILHPPASQTTAHTAASTSHS